MQAIIDEIEAGRLEAEISVVISNKEDAPALETAGRWGLPRLEWEHTDLSRYESLAM